jgi:hypothetical protein
MNLAVVQSLKYVQICRHFISDYKILKGSVFLNIVTNALKARIG